MKETEVFGYIWVRQSHNDLILTASQGIFPGTRSMKGGVLIGYNSLIKYLPNYINTIINENRITCGFVTFILAMALQSDLWMAVKTIIKFEKLYLNALITRLLQISKTYDDEYKNKIFTKHLNIHIIYYNAVL